LDAKSARVQLVEIPYVSLRSGVTNQLTRDQGISFSEAVRKASLLVGSHDVHVDVQERTLRYGEMLIQLKPLAFLVWLWLALRLQSGAGPVARNAFNRQARLREEFWRSVRRHLNEMSALAISFDELFEDKEKASVLDDDGGKWLGERVNEINASIKKALGDVGQELLGVSRVGKRSDSGYVLKLAPERIQLL
jgi:hypothetical protein